MKRSLIIIIALIAGLLLGGCAYVHTKTPYDENINSTDLGTKVGVSEAYSILWIVAWGDASYAAAAKNGNIKVLKHADQETFQIFLGAFTRWRIIVYGD